MEAQASWEQFVKSGRINDYLAFVNFRREKEVSERGSDEIYDRSACNKGNECRGE